jgi:cytidylate kinase
MIITIDGPSAAGKGTVARLLAARLGMRAVDTGALYRAVAWWIGKNGLDPDKDEEIQRALARFPLSVTWDGEGRMRVMCGTEDISEALRSEEVGMLASRVSARRVVRESLWRIQRDLARSGRMIFEGRDTGSQVFPDADFRFYLTASLEERARRRFLELAERGVGTSIEEVAKRMELRDRQDATRALAPLKIPEGAHVIDTTGLTPGEVVDRMVEVVGTRVRHEH